MIFASQGAQPPEPSPEASGLSQAVLDQCISAALMQAKAYPENTTIQISGPLIASLDLAKALTSSPLSL